MRHDMQTQDPKMATMPMGREAMPDAGEKPVPALQKSPAQKGTSPNATSPGGPRNRKLTHLLPLPLPGAPRAAAA